MVCFLSFQAYDRLLQRNEKVWEAIKGKSEEEDVKNNLKTEIKQEDSKEGRLLSVNELVFFSLINPQFVCVLVCVLFEIIPSFTYMIS